MRAPLHAGGRRPRPGGDVGRPRARPDPAAPGRGLAPAALGDPQERLPPALVALAAALLLGAVLGLAGGLLGAPGALAQVAGVEVVRAQRLLDEHQHLA